MRINLVTSWRFNGSGFPCTQEHIGMQWAAFKSWGVVGANVHVIAKQGQVFWRDIAEQCVQHDVAAQIDGDIILTEAVVQAFNRMREIKQAAWATSHRRCFPVGSDDPVKDAAPIRPPYGLSMFIGNKAFWTAFLRSPAVESSKFGNTDDQAVCSFGNVNFQGTGFDFTGLDCMFHPDHEGRMDRNQFNLECKADISHCWLPKNKILPP